MIDHYDGKGRYERIEKRVPDRPDFQRPKVYQQAITAVIFRLTRLKTLHESEVKTSCQNVI